MPQVTVDVQQAGFAEIGCVGLGGLKDKATTFARAVQFVLADKIEELCGCGIVCLGASGRRGTSAQLRRDAVEASLTVARPFPRNAEFQR